MISQLLTIVIAETDPDVTRMIKTMKVVFPLLLILMGVVYFSINGTGRALLPQKIRTCLYSNRRTKLPHYYSFYERHFSFFNVLRQKEQDKFIHRVLVVRNSKEFHAASGIVMDDDKIMHICGSLVQLTFGYRTDFDLPKFEQFRLYPDIFYSSNVGQDVKGLTHAHGIIYLSWKHYEEGYANSSDKVNLGLHELAHAFMLEMDNFSNFDFNDWKMQAIPITREMKMNTAHFFRQYGSTNLYEFWAVCAETFFESPLEFRKLYPELYRHTAVLLQQDYAARLSMFDQSKTYKLSNAVSR